MSKTKRDEHGEYRENAGSPEPLEQGDTHPESGKKIKYDPCNAVLKYTHERYGEVRYCTAMGVGNFGDEANYEHPERCRHHQSREELKDHQDRFFKTGAFASSYEHVFQYLSPHKKVLAINLFADLLEESEYNFEPEMLVEEVEAPSKELDTAYVEFPVPTKRETRGQALWYAAIDMVRMQNIHEEQFKTAFEEDLAVGEKEFEKETESGHLITIRDEHHLNLPLSRIQKDYERHLKFGGVSTEPDSDGETSVEERTWVLEVDKPKPEADVGTSPMADMVEEVEVPEEDS